MIPSPTVNVSPSKFGLPKSAAMTCMTTSLTSEFTTALNATPMTTATARSTTLPRRTNAWKSFHNCFTSLRLLANIRRLHGLEPGQVTDVRRRSERVRLEALDDHRHALAAADAHALHAVARTGLVHAVEERGHDARAGHAERVAERDRAAVHVELPPGDVQLFGRRHHLRGEGLVDLDEIDVVD